MPSPARPDSLTGEDRIREAFEYAAVGMGITDLAGHFEETNPAYRSIAGRTEEELERETIFSVTHPDDREECQHQLGRLRSGDLASFVIEKRYIRPVGDSVWVRNSFSLLRDSAGAATHIILICHDISDRRRAERLLVESEKLALLGQLASSVAHEINDPLETVMNLLFLIGEASTLEESHRYAAEAQQEIQQVAQIAAQMLRFRKQSSKPAKSKVGELLDAVLLLYKGRLAQAHVRVHLDKVAEPELVCYPGEIRQVFANIVRNAIDAIPRGGDLWIRLRPATHWAHNAPGVRITLMDNGVGISSKARAHIYEPFFTTKSNSGTGLGLWVTAKILRKHHGSMHVRSSDVPKQSWTAFTLVLPCSGAEGEDAGLGVLDPSDSLAF